jgi:hypothetical protein
MKSEQEERDAKRARDKEIIQSFRITSEEKKELANEESKEEWVQEVRAAERELMKLGWSKEELNVIVAYYESKIFNE